MSHFADGVLQAYLDNEVVADARAQVMAHVSGCADCSARLQDLRELNATFSAAIESMDVEPLTMAALAELRVQTQQQRERHDWVARLRSARRPLLRAAVLVFGVLVATVPGSPVRAFLVEAWNTLTEQKAEPAPPVVQPEPEIAREPVVGIQIPPVNGRVRILLQRPARETRIHVTLVDSDKARVQTSGGAANTRNRTGQGFIELAGGGAGDIRIQLPRQLESGTIEVDGQVLVVIENSQIRYVGTGSAQTEGSELIFQPTR